MKRLAVAGVLFAAACASHAQAPPENQGPLRVGVIHPKPAPWDGAIDLPGEVHPDMETTVRAKIAGYLAELRVDRGDKVTKGEKLGRIEAPELEEELSKARHHQALAQANLDRLEQVHREAPALLAKARLDAAKGAFEEARHARQQIEASLAYTTLRAPFEGIVTRRAADVGALLSPSNGPSGEIVSIMKVDPVRVVVDAPESAAPWIVKGLPATVRIDALPDQTFTGQVARTGFALDTLSRTLRVEVEIPNPAPHPLRPGYFARVVLRSPKPVAAVSVPAEAVLHGDHGAMVFVVATKDGGEVVERRSVTVLHDNGASVLVGAGLSPEDRVITQGRDMVADRMRVVAVEGNQ